MSQPLLIKVYANIFPCSDGEKNELCSICAAAMPEPDFEAVNLEKDLLTISFEGIWFPLEECVACIKKHLASVQNGKLDYLDIENWQMTRFVITDGQIKSSHAPLNHVLDYSGF